MGCKSVFWAEVAQGCIGGGIDHKKASRVVKHREAILESVYLLFGALYFSNR